MNWRIKDKSFEGKEKHVPEVEIRKEANNLVHVKVEVGKEVSHPNQPDHHISWIEIFFVPENEEPIEIARVDFRAHGELEVLSEPYVELKFRTSKPGKLVVLSYCNKHGIWKEEINI